MRYDIAKGLPPKTHSPVGFERKVPGPHKQAAFWTFTLCFRYPLHLFSQFTENRKIITLKRIRIDDQTFHLLQASFGR